MKLMQLGVMGLSVVVLTFSGYIFYKKYPMVNMGAASSNSEVQSGKIEGALNVPVKLSEADKASHAEKLHFVGSEFLSKEVDKVIKKAAHPRDENPFSEIKKTFPELVDEIEQYEIALAESHILIGTYKRNVQDRNDLLKSGQSVDGLDYDLKRARESLLATAEALGRKAIVINEAIREQAKQSGIL